MSNPSLDELLRPSLSLHSPGRAPYSSRVGFLTSFFGGPLAALALCALNGWRIGRLRRDLAWVLPVLLAYAAFEGWLALHEQGRAFQHWLVARAGMTGPVLLQRVLGLLVFGIGSLMHRREQRTMVLMNMAQPNGTWIGLALIVAGTVLHLVLLHLAFL